MPRSLRNFVAGECYHVLNRGNGRARIFHKNADYLAFLRVLAEGLARYPVDLLSWCVMPNHWHLVLRPRRDGAISDFMRWIGVTHVRRHHEHHRTRGGGHVYQGRFKSFPVQDDSHFRTVCRYVEANARRAGIVKRAEQYRWCSLGWKDGPELSLPLDDWPVDKPANWVRLVNEILPKRELEALHESVNRGRPFGGEKWVNTTAKRLGLLNSLRPPGRPKSKKNQ
ncbi:transposase [soil metagenome]